MNRKDYEAIAEAVAEAVAVLLAEQEGKYDTEAVLADIFWGFADLMDAYNPNFDRDKFMRSCLGKK